MTNLHLVRLSWDETGRPKDEESPQKNQEQALGEAEKTQEARQESLTYSRVRLESLTYSRVRLESLTYDSDRHDRF